MKRPVLRAFAVLASLVAAARLSAAYPGDVFQSAAPVSAPDRPSATPSDDGASVSESGSASYRLPIVVPPGRGGMQPRLAVVYSSSNPVRGGLAAGWELPIPRIELDTSQGRLGANVYRSSESGRLVPVSLSGMFGTTYFYGEEDASYTRYVRVGTTWQARTTDGAVYTYGDSPAATDGTRWFLTRAVDRFGNEVVYTYEKVSGKAHNGRQTIDVDIALKTIEYGANATAGLSSFARVELNYAAGFDVCSGSDVPIGSQFTYRSGLATYRGARRLDTIAIKLKSTLGQWLPRRQVALGYDQSELSCPSGLLHAPLRMLTSVTETAWAPDGTATTMPPTTFSYGRRERLLTTRLLDESEGPNLPFVDWFSVGTGSNTLDPQKAGGWPTIESMMLDLDGDGQLDRLASEPAGGSCGFSWARNLGDGTFAPPVHGVLPRMPWNANSATPDEREGCSLAAQFSTVRNVDASCGWPGAYLGYRFMDVTGDGQPDLVTEIDSKPGAYEPTDDTVLWPSGSEPTCPDEVGACVLPGTNTRVPCMVVAPWRPTAARQGSGVDPWNAQCGDGTCPAPNCGDLVQCECSPENCNSSSGTDWPVGDPQSPAEFTFLGRNVWHGPWWLPDVEIGDEYPGRSTPQFQPLCVYWPEMRCGRYVLRVYINQGNGTLTTQPQIILSPIPLESDRPTSDLGAGHLAASSSWHGFLDMDGDNVLDAVYQTPEWGNESTSFQVFRGDGTGNFRANSDGTPYLWSTPTMTFGGRARVHQRATIPVHNGGSYADEFDVRATETVTTLVDINGDELPDYIDRRDGQVRVYFNTGAGFDTVHTTLGVDNTGAPFQSLDMIDQVVLRMAPNDQMAAGWSRAARRQLDLDHDGMLDMVGLPVPQEPNRNPFKSDDRAVRFYANVGDRLVDMGAPSRASAWWQGLGRIQITDQTGKWQIKSDFTDLDGDGLEEMFTSSDTGVGCDPDPVERVIDNVSCGQYDPRVYSDPKDGQGLRLLRSVSTPLGGSVGFEYAPVPFDRNARIPFTVWAVSRMTTDPGRDPSVIGRDTTSYQTSYAYAGPVYNQDPHDEWGFRGFEQVTTTSPAGARAETEYRFDQDYGGLAVARTTYAADGTVQRRSTMAWTKLALFGGVVWSWAPSQVVEKTCGAGQSLATCVAQGATRQVDHGYSALVATHPSTGPTPVVWAETSSSVRGASYPGEDERSSASYFLRFEAGGYRLVKNYQSRSTVSPARTVEAVRHIWDAPLQLESSTHTFATEGVPLVHERQFDVQTGNLIAERKPSNAGSGPWATYGYDTRKLYVATTTNELGHVIKTITDPGTGVVTSARGPNHKSCGSGCDILDGSDTKIDGFGRPLSKTVYVDDAVAGYKAELAQRWTYTPAATFPTWRRMKIVAESRIETGASRWVRDEVEVDGVGRVTKETSINTGVPNAVTTYNYDTRGLLASVDVPRPSARDGSTVRYTVTHDSLGRVTASTAPDGTGTDTGFDGLVTTVSERVGDGSPASTRQHVQDVDGRLREVRERLDDGTWAITRYEYDGNDNVRQITDPAGAVTVMAHDMLSRRTSVQRGGQSWTYGYDADGNMITIVAPVPIGGDPARHTTSIVYDDLGRPASRIAGRGNLDDAQLARYGAASVTWSYDQGANGLGRLSSTTTPGVTRSFTYDAFGHELSMTESFSLLPGVSFGGSRTKQQKYDLLGNVTEARFGDGGTFGFVLRPETVVTYGVDGRGHPEVARWASAASQELARLSYTSAGVVDQRVDALASSPVARLTWSRDDLGRPTRFLVESRLALGTTYTVRADQQYTWRGSSDLGVLTTALSSGTTVTTRTWNFGYDTRHQLVSASGPNSYVAAMTYDVAGKLATASIDANIASVLDRNVSYRYDATDPQAVSALVDRGSGGTFASYQYDASGNMTSRTRGVTLNAQIYDGANLQREATLQDGTREVYFYDEAKQRRFVLSYSGNTLTKLRWTFGGAELEYASTGTLRRTDAYVSLGSPVARIHKDLAASTPAAELLFHNSLDHLIAVVDASGNLRAGFSYTPFGEVLEQIGSSPASYDRTFNGKQQDDVSDLAYYGHRYYDPVAMTWTQADPFYRFLPDAAATAPRRANRYTFSLNNPLRFVDANGLDGQEDEDEDEDEEDPEEADALQAVFDSITYETLYGTYADQGDPRYEMVASGSDAISTEEACTTGLAMCVESDVPFSNLSGYYIQDDAGELLRIPLDGGPAIRMDSYAWSLNTMSGLSSRTGYGYGIIANSWKVPVVGYLVGATIGAGGAFLGAGAGSGGAAAGDAAAGDVGLADTAVGNTLTAAEAGTTNSAAWVEYVKAEFAKIGEGNLDAKIEAMERADVLFGSLF